MQPTEKELIDFAVEEEFLLFFDEDDFVQIAQAVLQKWGALADLAASQAEVARLRGALETCNAYALQKVGYGYIAEAAGAGLLK